jgi:hypothetical protein
MHSTTYKTKAYSAASPTWQLEVIPIQNVNEAYERLLKSDVKVPLLDRYGFAEIGVSKTVDR